MSQEIAGITGKLGESTGSPQASFPMHSVNAAPLALPGLAVFALMVHPVATIVGIGNVKGKEHDSRMSIVNVRFGSEALGKQTGFNVIHPDLGEGPYPVLIQLHGYSDDSYSWLYNSNLVRHVAGYPLIVVLPDGGTSRYLNLPWHEKFGLQRYEDLVMRDIPQEAGRLFHVRPGPWAIGGLSMGGFGALRLGMKHPDRFSSIWAHSAGLRPVDAEFLARLDDPADALVETYADRLVDASGTPRIAFDCGLEDELLSYNRDLDAHLTRIGLDHHYAEHPGAHTWDYWDDHVREALARHADVLGIAATET